MSESHDSATPQTQPQPLSSATPPYGQQPYPGQPYNVSFTGDVPPNTPPPNFAICGNPGSGKSFENDTPKKSHQLSVIVVAISVATSLITTLLALLFVLFAFAVSSPHTYRTPPAYNDMPPGMYDNTPPRAMEPGDGARGQREGRGDPGNPPRGNGDESFGGSITPQQQQKLLEEFRNFFNEGEMPPMLENRMNGNAAPPSPSSAPNQTAPQPATPQ